MKKELSSTEKMAIINNKILVKLGQRIKLNCPPLIALQIEINILKAELELCKTDGYYDNYVII